jgi:hypothetical protein
MRSDCYDSSASAQLGLAYTTVVNEHAVTSIAQHEIAAQTVLIFAVARGHSQHQNERCSVH